MKMYLYLSSVISLYRDKRCHNHHQLDKPKSNDGGVLPLSFFISPVCFAEIFWLMLMLMLICYERKTLFVH
jgi:hypothetical protein